MKLCVLSPSYEGSKSPFAGLDPVCDPSPWLPEHEWHHVMVHKATATQQVRDLQNQGYDCIVNLCDGAFDEDRPGWDVVQALERYGLPFTGADQVFYEPSREAMKRVCFAWGIGTAEYAFVRTTAEIDRAAQVLRFPVIVKHPSSYASIGMFRDARCTDAAQLHDVAARMVAEYGQALVEEFVEGREFTVLISEDPDDPEQPHAYVPMEVRFPPGETFKHFDLKWTEDAAAAWTPVTDEALSARLKQISRDMFVGCRGRSYGRTDIRMDAEGNLFMLEINSNCGIFYPQYTWGSADWILHTDPGGHAGFIQRIIAAATRRHREAAPPVEVVRIPGHGYGLRATREIAPGELVQRGEGQPHVLVSSGHVAGWNARQREWFARYAWPIGPETFAIWHADPDRWMPIDHSCDANTAMDGLDQRATRTIAAGDAVTLDYAGFCGDAMAPFTCTCGATSCRGTIRGSDAWDPVVAAKLGPAVSPWVAWQRGQQRDRGDR